ITTTIPYVNAAPHIGFALELVQADALARYARLLGHRVRFQTGTDENAFKNVLSARERGVPTEEFVGTNTQAFRQLTTALLSSHDDFVRTTEPRHRHTVHQLWNRLAPGDLYEASYQGLYCNGCEDFLLEKDLVDGRCPDHGTIPEPVAERNHFFRLSRYQDRLEQLIASDTLRVVPETRKNEVLRFIQGGLRDISVSRSTARSGGWGIPVPGDPDKVIYVWIDALVNYLSGPGNGDGLASIPFWDPETRKVHVIGKNVWKFHAVYWPALLLSAGLPVPDEIVVHGFLTVNGHKISKTKIEGVPEVKQPAEYIAQYGPDAVRYYLLRAIHPFHDSDFTEQGLVTVYTADLANGLGNLCTRLTTLCARADVSLPTADFGKSLLRTRIGKAFDDFRLDLILDLLANETARLNREIAERKPWEAFRDGQEATIQTDLAVWANSLRDVLHWLAPVLPQSTGRALSCLDRNPIQKCPPLFPRL
ncbi:MAG: methionine--tRNA ligase, partial [Lentisphaeria bacterium]|nr:methionine--tRNA ligase [Lentisphaeria bacterium]